MKNDGQGIFNMCVVAGFLLMLAILMFPLIGMQDKVTREDLRPLVATLQQQDVINIAIARAIAELKSDKGKGQ